MAFRSEPLSVVVKTDDALVRAFLTERLERAGVHVAPEGAHAGVRVGDDVGEGVELDEPDAVVLDLGLEPARAEDLPETNAPLLVLASGRADALSLVRAGAQAVLARQTSDEALIAALSAMRTGLVVIDPALFPAQVPRAAETLSEGVALTARELEVLALLADGLSNKQIARALQISEHTAKFHVNAILNKLEAETRTEAVVRAARLGVLML